MVDLIESIRNGLCVYCVEFKGYIPCKTPNDDCEFNRKIIKRGVQNWLSSFDTDSATKCFEAVNILKMKIAQEEMHEADERLLNSDWGEMEVQE